MKKSLSFLVIICLLTLFLSNACFAQDENTVDVTLEILDSLGNSDFYVGDYLYTNSQ